MLTRKQVKEAIASTERTLSLLRQLDRSMGNDPTQATADAAIANLTPAGLDLVHAISGHGGRLDYDEALTRLDLGVRQLGGVLSGITKRALPGEPAVVVAEKKDGGWDLVIHPNYQDTVLVAQIGA